MSGAVDRSGDAWMDQETQLLGDEDAGDDESPLAAAGAAAFPESRVPAAPARSPRGPEGLAGRLLREDDSARLEALQDAASAAEALKAARGELDVIPILPPNPYALGASGPPGLAPGGKPEALKLKPKASEKTHRFESPEKKHKTDSKGPARSTGEGLEAPPLFGGKGGMAGPSNPQTKPSAHPEVFHLDPAVPSWVTELRDMVTGRQREIMSELHNHKTQLTQVGHQVQHLDRKHEDLSKAQADMCERLNNMEAEVKELRSRSRSVSPGPPTSPAPT